MNDAFAAFDRTPKYFLGNYSNTPTRTHEGCVVATGFSAEGYDRATKEFFGLIEHVTLHTNDNTSQGNP